MMRKAILTALLTTGFFLPMGVLAADTDIGNMGNASYSSVGLDDDGGFSTANDGSDVITLADASDVNTLNDNTTGGDSDNSPATGQD